MKTAQSRGWYLLAIALTTSSSVPASAFEVVLNAQGEYLDAYFDNGGGLQKRVLVAPDDPNQGGRHLNGRVCFFPESAPASFHDKFVVADDTYREACVDDHQARCDIVDAGDPAYVGRDADGWGVFNPDATWDGTVISTGTTANPDYPGTADPQGCAFDANGNLIGNDVGGGTAGEANGNLVMFFVSGGYTQHCFLATGLASPGMPVKDGDTIYVPQSGGGVVTKFSPPFPNGPADCDETTMITSGDEEYAVPVPDSEHTPAQSTFVVPGAFTPISLVRRPSALGVAGAPPSWYVGSVLLTPTILEVVETPTPGLSVGVPVRPIVLPFVAKNPIGMDVGSDGTVYYAELNLTVPDLGTGCGSLSMVKFDPTGLVPLPPVAIRENLRFPDGVTVVDSDLFDVDWDGLPQAPPYGPSNCGGE